MTYSELKNEVLGLDIKDHQHWGEVVKTYATIILDGYMEKYGDGFAPCNPVTLEKRLLLEEDNWLWYSKYTAKNNKDWPEIFYGDRWGTLSDHQKEIVYSKAFEKAQYKALRMAMKLITAIRRKEKA